MTQSITSKLDSFFSNYTKVSFSPGDTVITGNTPNGVFYLKQGYIRQFSTTNTGEEILHNIYKPATFFPMTWALADIPNRYYFEAVTPVTAYRASVEATVEFLQSHPEILFDLTRRLLIGLDAILLRLEHVQSRAEIKVIYCLTTLARRFSNDPDSQPARVTIRLSQSVLASMAGVTKETFSRHLSSLKKQGLVDSQQGKLIIKDLASLESKLVV